jgi:hypothetical protein
MTTNGTNGNGTRLLWWLVGGIFAPLVLGLTSHGIATLSTQGERLSRLEAEAIAVQQQLQRIEVKLDKLLGR